MEGKVLLSSQPQVTNQFSQYFLNRTTEQLWILGSISLLAH
jgi:hypothetical protein